MSWRIGRLLGIDVYMQATYLILLIWLGISYYLPRQRMADVVSGLTLIVALFAMDFKATPRAQARVPPAAARRPRRPAG